jgi:hypothetical protein
MAGSGAAMLLVAAIGRLVPIRDSEAADAQAADDIPAPAIPPGLKPRSGPIVARIDYHVPEESLAPFLALMRERRRAQSRIGARHWTLLRNLESPAHWTESFRTPTWTDYLRLALRRGPADRELDDRLLRLHAGPCPPVVTLAIERPTVQARKPDQLAALFPQR